MARLMALLIILFGRCLLYAMPSSSTDLNLKNRPQSECKVLIFTYSYNRPDFIEIQYKTFKQFVQDDYEFVVFNDAPLTQIRDQIEQKCEELGIRCINIPQEIHKMPYLQRLKGEDYNHPSVRNSNVVQYSLDTLGFQQNTILALFDSDLFLVKNFSFEDFLNGYQLAGLPQNREKNGRVIDYLWIGLFFIDMRTAPNATTLNFNCGVIDGINVDAGGFTHYYLRKYLSAKVRYFNQKVWPFHRCSICTRGDIAPCTHNTDALIADGFDEHQIAFLQAGPNGVEFLQDNCFMHYRGGTNWDYQSENFHIKKTELLYQYIDSILEEGI